MSFIAAAIGGVAAAGIGALGANSAADKQAGALRDASSTQQQMFQQQRADLAPFREAGTEAAGKLNGATGGINQTDINQFLNPGIDFAMKWGQQGVSNLQNASGGAFSGNTLKAISDYTTGTALNQYWQPAVNTAMQNKQNIFSNLYNVANLGATASGAGATGSPAFSGQIGSNMAGAGAAQAGGTVGIANALGSGINNAGSWYSLGKIMNPSTAPAEPELLAG